MAAEFDTSHVKNIVLLGHAGAGKTTLAECLLFEAGLISKRGRISEKNTVGDYHDLERERGNTIFSKLMHTKWRGYKINIIDTPGYDDFSGEVISALRVADTGIMLLNAAMGVEVGTDMIWQYTEQFKTPMIFAINHLDDESADYETTLAEAKQHFSNKVTVIQYPLQQGEGFHCIIDVLRMTMYKFKDAGGKPEKLPIPDSEREKADRLHKELIEAVAGNDEGLMEKYFDKGELDEDEIKTGMKKAMINHDLFPLFCLSAERNMGCGRLMGFIDNVCPSANEMPPQITVRDERVACEATAPVCAFVFKSVSESHVGDLSFLKIFSGTLKTGMELVNETTGVVEKINQLFIVEGNKRINVNELSAGDIGATLKLKNTHVNNTLHEKGSYYELRPIAFPPSNMSIAISNLKKGEEEKLAAALHQLREEDPTIVVEVSSELKQTILHCQGDMHLAVIKWKLQNQFKVDVAFTDPRIPYRETIRTAAEAVYRHKKQSGGAGQFGEVHMRIEPWFDDMPDPQGLTVRGREVQELPWGGKLAFYNCIVGGAIDQRFLPSVLKGVMEKMQEGPLTGSHVRDIRVSVFDGRMHPVDSNDISFKIAGLMAFKNAFQLAAPQLLEPIAYVEILCPENITGSIIGDLQTRRALIEGISVEASYAKITAKVPLSEMNDYSSTLRSLTQGRAKFNKRFLEYAVVSFEAQKKLTEAYNKLNKEEMVG